MFFITQQNYANADLDKRGLRMYLKKGTLFKKGTLSTEIEYYKAIREKMQTVFQNIVVIFKINSIDFRFFCFYM